jgi:deoxyribodipyrimidine photolyase-related protein
LLNSGIILPKKVIEKTINFYLEKKVPLSSVEGFLRQIVGWREFIRGVYEFKGGYQRTRNFFNFKKKMPKAFFEGKTGIEPFDNTVKKIKKYGYCHHIERLMILGNFFLLCEIDPDEVYRFFMTYFIDAYDWVMVPNVYGMSQYADGGLMSTKPYFSSSGYLLKMSDYQRGDWVFVWDGLFWRFLLRHKNYLLKNPRVNFLVQLALKRKEKIMSLIEKAEIFLDRFF